MPSLRTPEILGLRKQRATSGADRSW